MEVTTFTLRLIDILILGVVQGVTGWLPVSSSGHLAIVQKYLGLSSKEHQLIYLDIMLHVGTLVVILLAFREDIVKIVKAVARLDFKTEEGKLALFILVGSVPTALISFTLRSIFESFFEKMLVVGIALLVTGFFLFASERRKSNKGLDYFDSLLIGIAQGIAFIPGISRSGFTIATGLLRKVKKEVAFRFSFLLSIPAVTGTAIASTITEFRSLSTQDIYMPTVLFGVVISMVLGYVSLKLLQRVVMKGKFHTFSYYCWTVGAIIIFYHLF
ncbi:MAG: undecaprenyl pyrophosphate phosphatase [Candidatus Bathyarchaeota archaeon BA2]|nr:MAG: undecaprenyl pyrophosphate phosphatase [Candidatus Bathyarchaeota archaeon BA2]